MAMGVLSGFHGRLRMQQLSSAWMNSDFYENLDLHHNVRVRYFRQRRWLAASSVIAPGTESKTQKAKGPSRRKIRASKVVRGEPVMAFRDKVAVLDPPTITLENNAQYPDQRGVPLGRIIGPSGRDLSPVGDPATALERSRLESQWTMSLDESVDLGPTSSKLPSPRIEEEPVIQEHFVAALDCQDAISSGKPKARFRRLEARQLKNSSNENRRLGGAFTTLPHKRVDGKIDNAGKSFNARKIDSVQGYVSTYLKEIAKIDRLTSDEEVELSKIVRSGYLMRQEREKLERAVGHELSKDQWAALLNLKVSELNAKLREAEVARDRMVMANLRLVVSVVKQYSCEGLEMADLIQEGSIGLLKGIERFDFTRGYKLSTYVHWWIRQGVTRAIADHSRTVRLPVHIHDTMARIRRARARILQNGDSVTVESIGAELNLKNERIRNVMKIPKSLKSLDKQVGNQRNFMTGDSQTFHSVVADQHPENHPWAVVEKSMLKQEVDRVLNNHLGSREREIIKMHFGIDCQNGFPMSLENISHRYGISRERVRQLERAAKQKLLAAPSGFDKYSLMPV